MEESNDLNILDPTKPLISAITIVRSSAQREAQTTIDCFAKQTWQNKELIIINCAETQWKATELDPHIPIDDSGLPIARIIDVGNLSAGMARNYAISAANGSVIAHFDANYWHAPNRLETQLMSMFRHEAHICVLSRVMEYGNGYARYLNNKKNCILNSIMFIRPRSVDYGNSNKAEELQFMIQMISNGSKPISIDRPELMCKLHNTNFIAAKSFNSSRMISDEHLRILNDAIKTYSLN